MNTGVALVRSFAMSQEHPTRVVPKEYGGRWIAWNFEGTKILASEATMAEAKRAAEATGEARPVLAKVPRANVRQLGGKR
jgi:hypothetical protein